jgi:nitrogen regulatory protein P-II 2
MANELKLLTIISDEALANQLEQEIIGFGYTITSVHGRGHSGERADTWTGINVKLETIVKDEIVAAILKHLQEKYFEKYPLIAYYHDVSAVRTNHFI